MTKENKRYFLQCKPKLLPSEKGGVVGEGRMGQTTFLFIS